MSDSDNSDTSDDDNPPHPPPNKKVKIDFALALGKGLYAQRQTGSFVDVAFSVTSSSSDGDPVKVQVHKNVLVATSSIFETMMKERWSPGDVINVPEKICVDAVELFVKFLYIGELDDGIGTDMILQIMLLADLYEIEGLFDLCNKLLIKSVNSDNCVYIYQHTRLFERAKIKIKSLDCILSNISNPLWQPEMGDWEAETLEDLLCLDYLKNVSEATLFRRLLAWRDFDLYKHRWEKFLELLKLVRFPLMTLEEFAEFIAPSGVLSHEDMVEIFVFFAGKGTTKFPKTKRNILVAKDSKEFKNALAKVVPGDVIQLCETIYDGPFILHHNNITIQGVDETKTILRCCSYTTKQTRVFYISASHCSVKNLAICSVKCDRSETPSSGTSNFVVQGDNNQISNILISNGIVGLRIEGHSNIINFCSITNSIFTCVGVIGNGNRLLNASFTFARRGYIIKGDDNTISNLQCKNVIQGVLLQGNNNSIQDITFKMVNPGEVFEKLPLHYDKCEKIFVKISAVYIEPGKNNNIISGVTAEGIGFEGADNRTWSIILDPETKFCNVEKCKGDGANKDGWIVLVRGESHTLIDVDGGHRFRVEGTGHKLEKCRAIKLIKVGAECLDEVKNCNFPSVVKE